MVNIQKKLLEVVRGQQENQQRAARLSIISALHENVHIRIGNKLFKLERKEAFHKQNIPVIGKWRNEELILQGHRSGGGNWVCGIRTGQVPWDCGALSCLPLFKGTQSQRGIWISNLHLLKQQIRVKQELQHALMPHGSALRRGCCHMTACPKNIDPSIFPAGFPRPERYFLGKSLGKKLMKPVVK